ncbi:hypothetical protein OGAPHI_001625 [Ogataea philodendri]|uniref:Mitochondrial import inner membrane translocase subunit TIM22 n=1 Tax=Ogataea philodendri TaxID=1378263 RepID=A0A9P8PDK1_9ASCO|nr:uncharacterized protein OGAPHI_001625 [Ogataea philodendri]KAH3669504.1 hypothetical protein OGAPHI_001625 [Ogataea philodendri]
MPLTVDHIPGLQQLDKVDRDRLGIPSETRLPLLAGYATLLGAVPGLVAGYRHAGMNFIAMNSHRLPRDQEEKTAFGRYRTSHAVKSAVWEGVRSAVRFGLVSSAFFGLEDLFDRLRRKKDFLNSTVSGAVTGLFSARLTRTPLARQWTLMGAKCGLIIGLAQDIFTATKKLIMISDQTALT